MKFPSLRQLFAITSTLSSLYSVTAQTGSLRDAIVDRPELSKFRTALNAVGLLELLDDGTQQFTVFAPTDTAIDANFYFSKYMLGIDQSPLQWNLNLFQAVNNHIVDGPGLTESAIFNGQNTELTSRQDALNISQFLGEVQGTTIETADIPASNGILHVVSAVVEPVFFQNSFANLELQPEFGPDDLGRVSLVDIVDFVGFRDELAEFRDEGTTQLGCRIRALNRIGLDYLPQTINDSFNITIGEFLNATRMEETRGELLYGLLPRAVYADDYPDGYAELSFPINDCAHMWVTKHDGLLVFNDAQTVLTPDPRLFIANNGPGYVIDRCLVCPGISMLTEYAADWTVYNMKDTAQFFTASEWNMRDLRRSVGSGGDLTLFAPVNDAWDVLNLEDITRLSTDKWKSHLLDLLGNLLVEQLLLEQDLKDLFQQNGGAYLLTSTIGEFIPIDYDSQHDAVLVSGGDIFYPDIKGVDGRVHFVTEVARSVSLANTVYDIANERTDLSTHVDLIDSVFLMQDLEFLLPLTAMYAPNDAWDGIVIDLLDIAPVFLENHLIGNLWSCDRLRANVGEQVETLNGQLWLISVSAANMPCFAATTAPGDPVFTSCIIECDILARNGIVHVMDSLLLYELPETLPPSPPISPVAPPIPTAQSPTFTSEQPVELPMHSPAQVLVQIPTGAPIQFQTPMAIPVMLPSSIPGSDGIPTAGNGFPIADPQPLPTAMSRPSSTSTSSTNGDTSAGRSLFSSLDCSLIVAVVSWSLWHVL